MSEQEMTEQDHAELVKTIRRLEREGQIEITYHPDHPGDLEHAVIALTPLGGESVH